MRTGWILAGLLVLGACSGAAVWAQTEAAPPQAVEAVDEVAYAYGTVKEVGTDRLVVTEYDYVTGTSTDVAYTLDPAVEYDGVMSLSEVAVGDYADIEFHTAGGQHVATMIAIEKPMEEGDVEEYGFPDEAQP